MKNKITIVLIVLVVAAALAGVYFIKQNKSQVNGPENNGQQNNNPSSGELAENQGGTDSGIIVSKNQPQTKIITDDFSIDLPSGWQQTTAAMGSLAMAVNMNEVLNDPAAQKISFKSYFAVSYDAFQERSMVEYVKVIKSQLKEIIPDIIFTEDKDMTISEKSAHAMEAEFTQSGADFKILMVIVAGQEDDVFILSFNTVKSAWDTYEGTFYNVANNFVVKK